MKRFSLLSLMLCLLLNAHAAATPGLNYKYYEGPWHTLPDFGALTAAKTGTATNISLTARSRDNEFAFEWTGFITIPAAGTYSFETYSDDGSKLYIGSTQVVNNDGEHPGQSVTGSIALNAGSYPVTITFFQGYGGQIMELYWSSSTGIVRQRIPDNAFTLTDPGTGTPPVTPPAPAPPSASDMRGINNYYFSALSGNDSRSAAQARDPATPWKTINKLNAIMSTLQPGDAVLFKRGETFTGKIIINQSGSAMSPLIFSAYGTGTKPVINGFCMLTSWTSLGNGIWEASLASGSYLNMVLINEVVQPMGRFPNSTNPNKGFLTLESHSGSSQLTDNELGTAPNWTGAEVVVRKNDWTLDRAPITAHYGRTLNFTSPTVHQPTDGYGYFIQNSPLTLDQQGEWYYNPGTKKLMIFLGSAQPKNFSIKASMVDTLVSINNRHNITFNNLAFRGADVAAFQINNASNIKVQYSDINNTGLDAISADNSSSLAIHNNLINHSNNSGIRVYQGSAYASISSNTIRNSGTIPGMGSSNNQQHDGIFLDGSHHNTIEFNKIDSSGYCGITFTGDYTTVRNNVVNYFCLTVNDGGGTYTWGGWDKKERKVTGNIVLNGIGAPAGTNGTTPHGAVGIYTDDRSTNIDISSNTVAHCSRAGIFLHNSHEINITGNTLYNNAIQLSMVHDGLEPADPVRNINTRNNVLSSSRSGQVLAENVSVLNDIDQYGSFNNNYYIRPTDQNGIITTHSSDNGTPVEGLYNLAGWRNRYGFDQQSSASPFTIPSFRVNRLIGANKFANGSFNSNIDGVMIMSSPGVATGSFNNGGRLDGGALQVSFNAGGPVNKVGTFVDFGAVTAGKTYLIRFSLLSAGAAKTMTAFILQNGGSYAQLSSPKHFDMTTTRTEHQFIFKAASSMSNVMVAFELNGTDCPFWLDNLQVQEAEVSLINAEDYMRLEYNGTAATKTVALSGTYTDAKNNQYTNTATIAPYSSLVLMKQPPVSVTQSATQSTAGSMLTATAQPETSQLLTEAITSLKVSPNPVHEKMQVTCKLAPHTQNATLSIYTVNGVKVKTISLPPATTSNVSIDVASLQNGMYIINILCNGELTTGKFVKQ